ncbi:MAG: hypothetical protein WKF83_09015 [Nocardioidaceae bacterium]
MAAAAAITIPDDDAQPPCRRERRVMEPAMTTRHMALTIGYGLRAGDLDDIRWHARGGDPTSDHARAVARRRRRPRRCQ